MFNMTKKELTEEQKKKLKEISDSIPKRMESLFIATDYFNKLAENFNKNFLEHIENQQKVIETHNKKWIDVQTYVNEQISKILNSSFLINIQPFLATQFKFNGLLEAFQEATKFVSEDDFKRFEYSWATFSFGMKTTRELYKLWKAGKEEEDRKYFFDMFNSKENINSLVGELNENLLFKPRIDIIKDALYAHLDKKYTLSVPVLWCQIEGVFIEKHKDIVKDKFLKCSCEGCEGEIKCIECGTSIPLRENVNNITRELSKKEETFPFVYDSIRRFYNEKRHKILHGSDIGYADPNLSTKLILLLHFLNLSEDKEI